MAGTASDLQTALQNRLATIPGLRVADHLPEAVNPPMAVVGLQQVTYHRAMRGGLSTWLYLVTVIAGRMGQRSSQLTIDTWISYDGAGSVRAAIEADPTLGGKADSLIVEDMVAIRPLILGDETYISCEFNVNVHA